MADDERLREALIELEELRQRERALSGEARALLSVLSGLKGAGTRSAALEVLLQTTQHALTASAVLVLEAGPPIALAAASGGSLPECTLQTLPAFEKPRNIADADAVPAWSGLAALGWRSILCAPFSLGEDERSGSIVALHTGRAAFSNADRQLLARIAELAGQSFRTLALQSRNALLAAAIDGSSSGFAIADARDPTHPLIFVNPAFEALTGYSSAEALGQNCRFLNAEQGDSHIRTQLRETVSTNGTGTFVLRNARKDGSTFWNELSLFPVLGPDGTADYLVATQTDVSPRIAAQEQSELNRQRMDDALAHTDAGFVLLNRDQNIRFSNTRFGQLLPNGRIGWARGTGFAENLAAYLSRLPPEFLTADHRRMLTPDHLAKPGAQVDVTLPDGRTLLMRAQSTSEGGVVVSATDITAQKGVERTLRARVAAIEHAPDGIGVADAAGRVLFGNPALARLLGVSAPAEMLGRVWSKAYSTGPDASLIDALNADLARAGTVRAHLSPPSVDGLSRRHDIVIRDVPDVGLILVIRDVTEERAVQAKRAELEEQLGTARRQQVVSQMAAGLAHDFGNLLSAINGSALLISGAAEATPALRAHADRITSAGNQAAWLVNRLLDLGRDTTPEAEFDLRQAVKAALDLLAVGLCPGVEVHSELSRTPLRLNSSPTEATQIALNVMLNAQDALAGSGLIRVWLGQSTAPEGQLPQVGRLQPGAAYAKLAISDDGSGITDEVLTQIFEPYFSTKGDQGTGLGLATVAAMVQGAGGAILVQSEPGQGTTFSIFWPLGPQDDAPHPGTDAVDLTGALVLVIDDEEDVAEVVGAYLEGLGAEVATVTDPELGIEAILEDPEAWSAVITDYNMGALTGGDVVEAVMASAPDLPVLIVTALSRRMADPRISASCVRGVFAKPPDLRHISEAIATHMAQRAPSLT